MRESVTSFIRILALGLAFVSVVFFSMNVVAASGDTTWQEDYEYTLDTANNTITLTEYKGAGGDIVIPASAVISGNTYQVIVKSPWDSLDKHWFFNEDNIVSFTAEDNVRIDDASCLFGLPRVTVVKNRLKLKSVVFGNVNTSNLTSTMYMFEGCAALTTLDLSKFNTSNVTTMYCMFYNCLGLTSMDLSNFNTGNVRDMEGMFIGCKGLTSLDLSNFDTKNVTTMGQMFYFCSNLETLNISTFNTGKLRNIRYMFAGCQNLMSLNLSSFDTSNVENTTELFSGCYKLSRIFTPRAMSDVSTELPGTMYVLNADGTTGDVGYTCLNVAPANVILVDTTKTIRPDFTEYRAPAGCVFQYRLYNPNSGEHFYTGSQEESMNLINAGWNFEGAGFISPTVGTPVYRMYSERYGDHLYTMNNDEVAELTADGWTVEGISFPSASGEGARPMYRLHNPNAHPNGESGAWHFTMDTKERDKLKSLGWEDQGIGWYSV